MIRFGKSYRVQFDCTAAIAPSPGRLPLSARLPYFRPLRFRETRMSPLLTQLLAAAALAMVATVFHGAGVAGIAHALGLDRERRRLRRLHPRTIALLSAVALMLFGLHLAEIALFAFFYLAVGALAELEEALFFSASAYATLAQPETDFPIAWRLVGALEGLAGFLLLGWSTAFFVTDMNKLLRQ
jgi:hypothetical protein